MLICVFNHADTPSVLEVVYNVCWIVLRFYVVQKREVTPDQFLKEVTEYIGSYLEYNANASEFFYGKFAPFIKARFHNVQTLAELDLEKDIFPSTDEFDIIIGG